MSFNNTGLWDSCRASKNWGYQNEWQIIILLQKNVMYLSLLTHFNDYMKQQNVVKIQVNVDNFTDLKTSWNCVRKKQR